jgi:hypothetical protein
MAQETLDFRCVRLSLTLRLLIPTFSLLYTPRLVALPLQRNTERSPTTVSKDTIRSFGSMFKPRYIVGAKTLD